MQNTRKRIIFLLSHPVQYYSPLFVEIAKRPEFDILVLYCSDENVNGHIDRDFGVEVKWDVQLLEGYNYKFMKNNSWKPSIFNGFWGLVNFEIFKILRNNKSNYLIINGWNKFTYVIAVIVGRVFGYKVCMRGDNPYNQEILKSKKLILLKKYILGKFLFKIIDYFLYVGKQNKEFYKYYRVPESKLIFTPHAVDNDKFNEDYIRYKGKKAELKKELGIPVNTKIILTVGKYISQKNPVFLLKAFHSLNMENTTMIFIGEGVLRSELEEHVKRDNIKNVYLTGFKNQNEIGEYYAMADIFVLASVSETWGLVVNEAMNFRLPLVLSDKVACADDLLKNKLNGFEFICSDIEDYKNKLRVLILNKDIRDNFGKESYRIIQKYCYSAIITALKNIN